MTDLTLRSVRLSVSIAGIILLAACGTSGTPTPAAVIFSSGASISTPENGTGAIYQAAATSSEGRAITYSIAGGSDSSRFGLTASGGLSFVSGPNFEAPTDADANNVYLVSIKADDGVASATLDLQVTVSNSKEGVSVSRVPTGFTNPIAMVASPPANELYVAEKDGGFYRVDTAAGTKTLLFSTNVEVLALAQGVWLYNGRPTIFALYMQPTGTPGQSWLAIGVYGINSNNSGFGPIGIINTAPPLPYTGWLALGPDGYLYIAVGDGDVTPSPASDASSLLGKLLRYQFNPDRLDVSRFLLPAPGNTASKAVFHLGLHNPAGALFYNGGIFMADRGANRQEISFGSITTGGANFGWPYRDGTQIVSAPRLA